MKGFRRSVLLTALSLVAVAVPSYGQDGPAPDRNGPRPPGMQGNRQRPDPTRMEAMIASMTLASVAGLPESKEVAEKHAIRIEPYMREFMESSRKWMRQVREVRESGDKEKVRELTEQAKTELMPLLTKLTEARLAYAAELLEVAKQNPDKTAARFADHFIKRRLQGPPPRPDGQRKGPPADRGQRQLHRPERDRGLQQENGGDVIE